MDRYELQLNTERFVEINYKYREDGVIIYIGGITIFHQPTFDMSTFDSFRINLHILMILQTG